MVRSLGFGSTPCNSNRPFKTRFRYGYSPFWTLTLLQRVTRRLIMQKARRHPIKGLRLLVGTRFQVLFHWRSTPAFHLSLAVLVHYRSETVFSLG